MAEYSRLASGQVSSTGGSTLVVIPFVPNFIEIINQTRLVAGAGVTSARWMTDMGQGAAVISTFGTGEQFVAPVGGTSSGALVSGTGFNTISAGLSLQYGPTTLLGASGSITKNSTAPVITTTTAHGLVPGNVVVFQNLYQTTTTGMQQIAGIPFVVATVPSTTTFTINWNTNQTGYTAIATGGLNGLASFKKVLYPVLYAPGIAFISALTYGTQTTVTTTAPHNYVVGQQVAFRMPSQWGATELNSSNNVLIPGSPVYGYVTSVTNSTQFVVNINSSGFTTAFNSNQPFASFSTEKFPQVVAVGDINSGGAGITATSQLYPSGTTFNGFGASNTVGSANINGPGITGAFASGTFMGFTFGSSVAGTAADVIYWRAYAHDLNT